MKLQYEFPDLHALHTLLDAVSDTRELPLPEGAEQPDDGDWVLASFNVGGALCHVPARTFGRGETAHVTFEDRDWERLLASLRAVRRRDAEQAGANPGALATPTKPRVLIVDHEADTCHIVEALLSKAGYMTGTVGTPEAALERLQHEDWQLVIADLELVGMSSPIFCRRIRSDRRCAALPILLISAKDAVEVADQARSVQADDFIIKPFRAPELIARSASLLQQAVRTQAS
jgi:two-component system phosphate regulon response regulator PhoB